MRIKCNQRLAEAVPEIDLILTGHDHILYHEIDHGCPIITSGSDFKHATEIQVDVAPTNAAPNTRGGHHVTWDIRNVTDYTSDPATEAIVATYVGKAS
jgi:2',3'-cyclic-nucleotide 2'-phosphodiesterase (5'-nucleotidase family)